MRVSRRPFLFVLLLGCARRDEPLTTAAAPAGTGSPTSCLAAMNEIERRVDAAGLDRRDLELLRRTIDVAIDDVCEQSMPNEFYGYCKTYYVDRGEVTNAIHSGSVQAYCARLESR